MENILTVGELKTAIERYLSIGGKDTDEVKLIDDGMKVNFYNIEGWVRTKFERKLDDAVRYDKPIDIFGLLFNVYKEV